MSGLIFEMQRTCSELKDPQNMQHKANVASLAKELSLYWQRASHAQSEINVAMCIACCLVDELSELLHTDPDAITGQQ
jgi:hypothetical protein